MSEPTWLVEVLRQTIATTVRQDARDLSQRQLGALLVCCLDAPPHTVGGLAAKLGISKPGISRAVDTLEHHELAKRAADIRDRRIVLVVPTASGRALVKKLGDIMEQSARQFSATPRMLMRKGSENGSPEEPPR
jgi:DNA-binding MarR family transcriptional regulator